MQQSPQKIVSRLALKKRNVKNFIMKSKQENDTKQFTELTLESLKHQNFSSKLLNILL